MKKRMIFLMTMTIVLGMISVSMADLIVIDFDEPALEYGDRDYHIYPEPYVEGDYAIEYYHSISRMAPGYELGFSHYGQTQILPEYDSPFLAITVGDPLFKRVDGKPFDLVGFSCAAWYDRFYNEKETVVGYKGGVQVVEGRFPLGYGEMKDYVLGEEWKNLDEVRFRSTSLIDDIKVAQTPVPAAMWLFGSGILGMVVVKRKNIKN